MGFKSDANCSTAIPGVRPRLGQRIARAALDVATSPLPSVALASLVVRALRAPPAVPPRHEIREAPVRGPALA